MAFPWCRPSVCHGQTLVNQPVTCRFLSHPFPLHVDIFKASLDVTLEKLGCPFKKRLNIRIRIFLLEVVKFSQALKTKRKPINMVASNH